MSAEFPQRNEEARELLKRAKTAIAWTIGRLEYIRDETLMRLERRLEHEAIGAMPADDDLELAMRRFRLLATTLELLDQVVDGVTGTAVQIVAPLPKPA